MVKARFLAFFCSFAFRARERLGASQEKKIVLDGALKDVLDNALEGVLADVLGGGDGQILGLPLLLHLVGLLNVQLRELGGSSSAGPTPPPRLRAAQTFGWFKRLV